jgi:hypothetical protein
MSGGSGFELKVGRGSCVYGRAWAGFIWLG